MKNAFSLLAVIAFAAAFAWAGSPSQTGVLIAGDSVACGSKAQGKKKSVELDCREYVIRANSTDYRVRQQKPANAELIPINTTVEFTLDKNKMKFKANGHSYDYLVVSEAPAGSTSATARP